MVGQQQAISVQLLDRGKEVLQCDYEGDAGEIGYNATYVLEILGRIDDEEAVFELSTPVAAGIIYSPNTPKDDFLCLIMPLRLAE